MFRILIVITLLVSTFLSACGPTPTPCRPGTVIGPDPLDPTVGIKFDEWYDLQPTFDYKIKDLEGHQTDYSYQWSQDSNTIKVVSNNQTEEQEIGIGKAFSFSVDQPMTDGLYKYTTITIAHCGPNSWGMSLEGSGRSKKIEKRDKQG